VLGQRVCVAFPLVVMLMAGQMTEAHLREKQWIAGVHLIRIPVDDFLCEIETIDILESRHRPRVAQQPTAQFGRDHGLGPGIVTQCDELFLVFHRELRGGVSTYGRNANEKSDVPAATATYCRPLTE
jgi:hypothetical protein